MSGHKATEAIRAFLKAPGVNEALRVTEYVLFREGDAGTVELRAEVWDAGEDGPEGRYTVMIFDETRTHVAPGQPANSISEAIEVIPWDEVDEL